MAFEIEHKTRGTYILCNFKAEGSKIARIEKDVNLSEQILRVLILTAEDRKGNSVKQDLAGETKAPQEMYNRDDRRPGSRSRDGAPAEKAGAGAKPSAEAKSTDATKEAGDKAETPASPAQAKPKEEARVSGDATSAGDTPAAPAATEQDAPKEDATAAGDAGVDAEPAKE